MTMIRAQWYNYRMSKGDSEVVASIVAGDPSGLAAAYDQYAAALYAYCCTLLHEPADAADAVQDTFVIASSRLAGLRDPERLRPWLYAVARNECLRRLRYRRAMAPLDEMADGPDLADETADVSGEAERADLRALMRTAIGGLNAAEREIIGLQLAQGLDIGEVAAVLGVSRNHAHSLLSRARTQLEASLEVILVGRTGRSECAELDAILRDWDGNLTTTLRKRVHRHIGDCDVCTTRRGLVLSPAAFGVAGPVLLAALAGRHNVTMAGQVTSAVKDQMLATAAGRDPAALARRAAITGKAARLGPHGFPRPLSPSPRGPLDPRRLLSSHRVQLASAAAGATAAAVTVAVLLAASGGPGTGLFKGGGPGSGGPPGGASAPVSTAGPSGSEPTGKSGGPGGPPATASPGPFGTTPGSHASQDQAGSAAPAGPAASASGPATGSSSGQPTAGQPTAGQPSTAAPSTSQSSSPPAATSAPATGTISVSPATIVLSPLLGGSFTITAQGGPVSWSASVPPTLLTSVTLSQSSGTVSPGSPVTVTVTTSLASLAARITVYPGGEQVTVLLDLL
ncbi:MAG TPA: sigma-70 family RNA polymerase sigma factor [Trebonia sp.]|jgi:RNA polymerase sigma factor (sigma-70 family)|nr:sigma-70 family RNA polymerase sigma factor [Trebonia sp.]